MEGTQREARHGPVAAALVLGLLLFGLGMGLTAPGFALQPVWLAVGLAAGLAGWGLRRSAGTWRPWLDGQLEQHDRWVDTLGGWRPGLAIALASGLGLFAELAVIRWHASELQLFGYFKNVSLLSCFLGLGIGYTRGSWRPLRTPLVVPLLALMFIILRLIRFSPLQDQLANPIPELEVMGIAPVREFGHAALVYGLLMVVFLVNALAFIPLGQLASRLMLNRPRLQAYGWNLGGSLAGILVFYVLSYLWSPPWVWMAFLLLGLAPFLAPMGALLAALSGTAATLLVLSFAFRLEMSDFHSPYQLISVYVQSRTPPLVAVNNFYFQRILNLSPAARRDDPELQSWGRYYEMPYRLKPNPQRVLILGSGTGNDVAAALRGNAGAVDAVEIDPALLQLGRLLHPEQPYSDPRVRAIQADARNHIRRSRESYDLIVYGLLDSHTLLSGVASVRLDSYVYTVEAFREARRRLSPDGAMVLTFSLFSVRQGQKLYNMLVSAFDGQEPRVFQAGYDGGFMYVIGPGTVNLPAPSETWLSEVTGSFHQSQLVTDVATDDWPFFYMPVRKFPWSYLVMIGVLLFCSAMLLLPGGRPRGFSAPCFFLGAGFMLIETKGITELALILGSTWVVVGAVVAAILTLAFLSNLLVMRYPRFPLPLSYGLVLASLGLGLMASGRGSVALAPPVEQVAVALLLTLPLFFSGLAFSAELDGYSDVPAAMSSNLLGAMCGGFLEFLSMYFGYHSLYVMAMILYALAFVAVLMRKRKRS